MANRNMKFGSGKDRFIGQSIIYPVPIELDPAEYYGAALVGDDGQFYYSNGLEWLVPVEDNQISRPSALAPFTVDEQTQLRLTPYRSPAGIEQAGAIFEISVNGTDFNGSLTRLVTGIGVNSYQILFPEDGFGPGDVILWRAAYVGEGGVQSNFSIPYRQTFPDLITTPSPITRDNAISGTVILTDFESASVFGYQYEETIVEFYEIGQTVGVDTPFYTMTHQDGPITTIPVPPLETATGYQWRGRYGGKITSVSPTVYSDWSVSRTVFVGAASLILEYDLSLATGRTVYIPLGGGTINTPLDVEIDWGDGQITTHTDPGIIPHTYDAGYPSSTVQVTISGTMDWYGTTNGSIDQAGLTRVENIGFAMGLTSLRGAFRNTTTALTFITRNIPETVTSFEELFYESSCAADLNDMDTRNIQNMQRTFARSKGVGPNCANWDVGNVTNVYRMFENSNFNSPFSLGNWTSLESMDEMFVQTIQNYYTTDDRFILFNQPIGYWDVSNVKSMRLMFGIRANANVGEIARPFNQNINTWDVSNVTDFSFFMGGVRADGVNIGLGTTSGSYAFNQPLNNWNTSSATNMRGMFSAAANFNQDISFWNVGSVTDFSYMFGAVTSTRNVFNRPLNAWNMQSAETMRAMFFRSEFNQPLSNWVFPNCTELAYMFAACPFNQPIGSWDVSGVQNFEGMFACGETNRRTNYFDQDLSSWDMSSAVNVNIMFGGIGSGSSQFQPFNNGGNPNINNWNMSNVQTMRAMFGRDGNERVISYFNQPIDGWDVSNVTDMSRMFAQRGDRSDFNQDISGWDFNPNVALDEFMKHWTTSFTNFAFSAANYSRLLTSFGNQAAEKNMLSKSTELRNREYNNVVYFPAERFTNAYDARDFLTDAIQANVTNASDANANGDYVYNSDNELYENSVSGWYLLASGLNWTLYDATNVVQATGTSTTLYPWDVTTWTGVLASADVIINGAAWTIVGDIQV